MSNKPARLGAVALQNSTNKIGRESGSADHGQPEHPAACELAQRLAEFSGLGEIHYFYWQRNLGIARRQRSGEQSQDGDWLAVQDIALILDLFMAEPAAISVHGDSQQPSGHDVADFVQLLFPGGGMAQLRMPRQQPPSNGKLMIVGSERVLVCDDLRSAASARVYEQRYPAGSSETRKAIDGLPDNEIPPSDRLRAWRVWNEIRRQLSRIPAATQDSPQQHAA